MKTNVPTYGLYGEASQPVPAFWIHAEPISERASRHGWEIRPHQHEHFFQIMHVRHGAAEAVIGDVVQKIEPGMLAFIPERTAHSFRFAPDVEGQIITAMTNHLPAPGDNHSVFRFAEQARLIRLGQDSDSTYLISTLERLEGELSSGFGPNCALIEAYLSIVLFLCSQIARAAEQDDSAAGRDAARIARLNHLIGAHYREHLPVEFYARELGVSVTHLNRITKAQTGRTMNELLSDKIIAQAKRDLAFTISTAQQIAHMLGFADPAYFTRFFAREAGETPRQFRERERSKQARPRMAAE